MLDLELLALFVLAALICNAAAGLAGRLAGSLAFAASAVLGAAAEVSGAESSDVLSFHFSILRTCFTKYLPCPRLSDYSIERPAFQGKYRSCISHSFIFDYMSLDQFTIQIVQFVSVRPIVIIYWRVSLNNTL